MSRTRVSSLSLIVDGRPEDVQLHAYPDGQMTVRLADGISLHLDLAPAATLRELASVIDQAAELKEQAAIVALNTPGVPTVDASVHTLRVADWGAAS